MRPGTRVVLFANTDWYLFNFRLSLARELRARGCDVVLVAPAGAYAERLRDAGFRFVDFRFDRLSLNPARQLGAVLRLATVYRRERPNIAHNFTIKCAVYGSLAARVVRRRPAVVNAIAGLGTVFSERQGRFQHTRTVVVQTLKIALAGTHVIAQNPEDRQTLIDRGIADADRTVLIRGSGVDIERFVPVPRGMGPLRVLLASRLLKSKGIDAFERAAASLRGRAEFLVAGAPDPGNPDTLREDDLAAMRVRGHVRILGHTDDMAAVLSSVDLVVLPTTYGEGVPRILIEAAAAGLPLVATDVPGCREIVVHGMNGVLVPVGDQAQLNQAIAGLIADERQRAAMGAESRRLAADFSERHVFDATIAVYASALA